MSTFVFTRNGVTYEIVGPAGATVEQAEAIFEAQLLSGSLIGLDRGQTLNLSTQLEQGLAVETLPVSEQLRIQNAQASVELPILDDVPLVNEITLADLTAQPNISKSIGVLGPQQLRALNAQTAKTVNQNYDSISEELGIGQYGFNATQLELAGYVKPGTENLVTATSGNLVSTLSSPAVWTGKDNINYLEDLLLAPKTQGDIQIALMEQSYSQLLSLGILTETESPQALGGILNIASKYGVATAVDWVLGTTSNDLIAELNSVAKQSEYAVNFSILNLGTGSVDVNILVDSSTTASSDDAVVASAGGSGNLQNSLTAIGAGQVPSTDTSRNSTALTVLGVTGTILATNPQLVANLAFRGADALLNSRLGTNSLGIAGAELLGAVGGLASGISGFTSTTGSSIGNQSTLASGVSLASAAASGGLNLDQILTNPGQLQQVANIAYKGADVLLNAGLATNTLGIAGVEFLGALGGLASGVSAFMTTIGPVAAVFGGLFGGGSGDSAGLNFTLNSSPTTAYGYTNTVNRDTLDAAAVRIYGNPKIPTISYGAATGNPARVDTAVSQAVRTLLGTLAVNDARQYQTNYFG